MKSEINYWNFCSLVYSWFISTCLHDKYRTVLRLLFKKHSKLWMEQNIGYVGTTQFYFKIESVEEENF